MFDEVEFGICNGRLDKGCKRNKEQYSQTILGNLYHNLGVILNFCSYYILTFRFINKQKMVVKGELNCLMIMNILNAFLLVLPLNLF